LLQRPGGVWFVDLTAVIGDSDVSGALAKAIGLTLRAGDLVEQVISYLADKAALVIVGNCEHVIDGCAHFAERFLASPRQASVLATSREALDVYGERTMVLGSLPSDGEEAPAGVGADCETRVGRSGRLFDVRDGEAEAASEAGR
jgi:predicted ATPase